MIADAEAAGRELAAFRSRRSPEGRFVSYCRGRARHFLARQLFTIFCLTVFLRVADPVTALAAAALVVLADGGESLLLRRFSRTVGIARRLPTLLALTAGMGALQALSIDFFLWKLMELGGADARVFAVAVCMAALLDSALLWGLHRWAALARFAVYGSTIAMIFALGPLSAGPGEDGMFYDLMAALLMGHIFVAFVRQVQRSRKRSDEKQELTLQTALDLAVSNAALRESQATARRLSTVAEQVADSIVITDGDGIVTWVNAGFTEMTGYSAREAVGQHIRLLNGPETNPEAVDILMTARRERRPARTQIMNRRKDGTPVWVETRLTPVLDPEGRLSSAVSVERDIGHIKAREAALAEASRAAAEASRAKQAFLATISHELRTPMNGIIGNAEMLLETELSGEQRGMVRTIGESAEALLDIVNDVLDLSALEAGRLRVGAAPFELADCLEGVARLMRPVAERKGLRFDLDLPAGALPRLVGDAGRLRQVLSNLLGNAIKFTETGQVALSVRVRKGGDRAALALEVRDTGIGIAENRLEEIFRSFTQASPDIAGRYGGTGLGLAISRQLVEAMGGTLTAESAPGAGSVFRVAVELAIAPAEEGEAASGARPGSAPAAAASGQAGAAEATAPPYAGLRLLVADDNPANLRLIEAMLRGTGAVVDTVQNGADAVARYTAAPPDAVFMDMRMPGLDGPAAARAIRREEAARGLPPVPVIALTANALAESREQCREAGMTGFLAKPVRKADLAGALNALLAARASHAPPQAALPAEQHSAVTRPLHPAHAAAGSPSHGSACDPQETAPQADHAALRSAPPRSASA
ncbi:MAG: ATP-binding protein [Paracoccaceae bacterium]|jgi:PAS domain S-box-containing protein|nr:ATP-binding protein [Paracoccaceae bacterium]